MDHTSTPPRVNPLRAVLISQAATYRTQADVLEQLAEQIELKLDDGLPIPLDLLCEHFPGTTKSYWRTRVQASDVPGVRLARQKIGVRPSDARACIEAHPAKFKPRKVEVETNDPIERAIASGRVQRSRR